MAFQALNTHFEAFSPRIVSTLFIADQQINIRATCEFSIRVETDRYFPPCDARIETVFGDAKDEMIVRLLDGIDPTRDEQPIRILSEM